MLNFIKYTCFSSQEKCPAEEYYGIHNIDTQDDSTTNMPPVKINKIFKFGEICSGIQVAGKPQDFSSLYHDHICNSTLFEDSQFPTEKIFVNNLPEGIHSWKRPTEIIGQPQFIDKGASKMITNQNIFKDCWFLNEIASQQKYQQLFHLIVPGNQSFKENSYAGIFHFRIWWLGKWIDVVIDDRLPVDSNGNLIFLKYSENNEFWVPLLEKAYAKLNGSYEDLLNGQSVEAMEDMTGGLGEIITLAEAPPYLKDIMFTCSKRNSLMSARTSTTNQEEIIKMGLLCNYTYIIREVDYVTLKNCRTLIITMRHMEERHSWKGSWSKESLEWQEITKQKMKTKSRMENTEFFISYEDFLKYFTHIQICYLNFDDIPMFDVDKGNKWNVVEKRGRWMLGITDGGCTFHEDAFHHNPQYLLKLIEKSYLVIALMQEYRTDKIEEERLHNIGFYIFKIPKPRKAKKPLNKYFFRENEPIINSNYLKAREVTKHIILDVGTYCIVPTTYEQKLESKYLLRIFSESEFILENNDEQLGYNKIVDEENEQDANKYRTRRLSENNISYNHEMVRRIINSSFSRSLNNIEISEDVSRSLLAMMDRDQSGKLSQYEFDKLWRLVEKWEHVWKTFDRDNSSTLDVHELREALNAAGYTVNNRLLNLLLVRYGTDNQKLNFNNFLMCAIKLKTMIDVFNRMSDAGYIHSSALNRFVVATLYS